MNLCRRLVLCVLIFALCAAAASGQADRPRKKMLQALTAIDVSAGVESLEYRASLPWMISQVLVYSGVKTNYADFCAVSGWSGEFHYARDKVWLAYLSLDKLPSGRCFTRGIENYGKRLTLFSWPEVGDEQDRLLAARAAWEFIVTNIGAGIPVLTDYIDGGVLYGYDETLEDPAIYFSTNGPGFGAIHRSKFNEIFLKQLHGLGIVEEDEPGPEQRTLLVGTLANLLIRAYEAETDGAPAGIAAMRDLAADLLDPTTTWPPQDSWLCFPLSEQTETRLCTAVYLRRNASLLGPAAEPHILAAADRYEEAFGAWRNRWEASWLTNGARDDRSCAEMVDDPGRREAIAGHVHRALGAELLALSEVQKALEALETPAP